MFNIYMYLYDSLNKQTNEKHTTKPQQFSLFNYRLYHWILISSNYLNPLNLYL